MRVLMRAVVAAVAAGLSGCGASEPPSVADLTEQLSNPDAYFIVTRPDGVRMWCNVYGDGTTPGFQASHSWFAYSCDWSGEALDG